MMKSFLLFATGCLLTGIVNAQSLEVGVNGGMSNTLRPGESLYQGEKGIWSYAADVNVHYNITERWQVGLSIGSTKWERKDAWALTGANGFDLGTHDVKYVFAKQATSFAFRMNHVVPFYQQYEDFVRSQLYVGLSAGAVITGNDGTIVYDRVNPYTPNEYTYTAVFHFESGYGFLLGAQIGYTYYFNHAIGINLDFSPKIAWMKTVDPRFNGANDLFSLIYYPVTAGIHFRF